MLHLTKIFHFELAHALHNYEGVCKNIHGHSYELHVTVCINEPASGDYLPAPGFIIDFKDLKKIVSSAVIEKFDHKLLLSQAYLFNNPGLYAHQNLVCWTAEPTAENLLIYISNELKKELPPTIMLDSLKLYETKDSYAEWTESSRNQIPSSKNQIPNSRNQIPSSKNQIPNSKNEIPNSKNQIPNSKIQPHLHKGF